MKASSLNRFAARAARERAALWPTVIAFRGANITVITSGLRETRTLEAGGFQSTTAATLRIQRTLLDSRPEVGEAFVVVETGISYRFGEVSDNPRSPEWLITVADISN